MRGQVTEIDFMKASNVVVWGVAIAAVIIGVVRYERVRVELPVDISGQPTNFVQIGTVIFPKKNNGQDVPYLSYRSSPAAPETVVELTLDGESVCATPSGSLPCMAMSVQYRLPFEGKRATVEAIEREARITVRKLRILAPEDEGRVPAAGLIYVPWMQAVQLMENCEPTLIVQTHDSNVSLTLKNGSTVVAVEPVIDEVFKVVQRISAVCGNLPIATE